MKTQDLRSKTDSDLAYELEQAGKELFSLRFKTAVEASAQPTRIRQLKRTVARIRTLLGERKNGIRGQEPR